MLTHIGSRFPKAFYGYLHSVSLTDLCARVSVFSLLSSLCEVDEHRELHLCYGCCYLGLCTIGLAVRAGGEYYASAGSKSRQTCIPTL